MFSFEAKGRSSNDVISIALFLTVNQTVLKFSEGFIVSIAALEKELADPLKATTLGEIHWKLLTNEGKGGIYAYQSWTLSLCFRVALWYMHRDIIDEVLAEAEKNHKRAQGDNDDADTETEASDGEACCLCGSPSEEDSEILLCDGCEKGWHLMCVEPPLDEVPPNKWYCPSCNVSALREDDEKSAVPFELRAASLARFRRNCHGMHLNDLRAEATRMHLLLQGFPQACFLNLDPTQPLSEAAAAAYTALTFELRASLLLTLCDVCMERNKDVRDNMRGLGSKVLREVPFGTDSNGASYFWFPLLFRDMRVYRQPPLAQDRRGEVAEAPKGLEYVSESQEDIEALIAALFDTKQRADGILARSLRPLARRLTKAVEEQRKLDEVLRAKAAKEARRAKAEAELREANWGPPDLPTLRDRSSGVAGKARRATTAVAAADCETSSGDEAAWEEYDESQWDGAGSGARRASSSSGGGGASSSAASRPRRAAKMEVIEVDGASDTDTEGEEGGGTTSESSVSAAAQLL